MPELVSCVEPGPSTAHLFFLPFSVTSTVMRECGLRNENTTTFPLISMVLIRHTSLQTNDAPMQ
jgi:hypothetical protein